MATASVTSKGRITIPIEIREELGLKARDRIEFIKSDGVWLFTRKKTGSVMDLKGIVKYTGRPFTIEEMNESVAQFLGEDDARIKRKYAELVARSQVPADK